MMSDNDRLVADYEAGLITLTDLEDVLATTIRNILQDNGGVFESLEMFESIQGILDIASNLKVDISVFTSVVCEGSEELIRYTIDRYLGDYMYFDRDEYDDLLLNTEEAVIPFLEVASGCNRFNTVYHVVFNNGALGLRVYKLLGYYLLMYDEIDWVVARYLYTSVNNHRLILEGISNWMTKNNFDRAMSRLRLLAAGEDV